MGGAYITDKYDRGYVIDIAGMLTVRDQSADIMSILSAIDHKLHRFEISRDDQALTYATASSLNNEVMVLKNNLNPAFSYDNQRYYALGSMSFYRETENTDSRIAINDSLNTSFGAMALAGNMNIVHLFSQNQSYSSPYLGFTSDGFGSKTGYHLTNRFSLNVGLSSNDDNKFYGLKSESGLLEAVYHFDSTSINFQIGRLNEKGNLFGGASQGQLSVDNSQTTSFGVGISQKLTDKFAFIANYTEGYSEIDEFEDGYLSNLSTIRSNAYGLGLVGSGIFNKNDHIGFGYSRPLKVVEGSVDVTTPQGRSEVGAPINFQTSNINLNLDGNEQDFEMYYSFSPMKNLNMTTYFIHKQEVNHNRDDAEDNTILTILQFKF